MAEVDREAQRKALGEKRVRNVLKALRLLRVMAKGGKSPFGPKETAQMWAHIDRGVNAAKEEFLLQDEFRFEG